MSTGTSVKKVDIKNEKAPSSVKDILLKLYPFVVLVVIVVLFEIWSEGKLLTVRNYKAIINEAFRYILGASALAFVISQGAIDLSLGSTLGLAAAIGAIFAGKFGPIAIFVTLAVGAVVGLINGAIYAKLRVSPFITTLAMSFMSGGLLDTILGGGSENVPYSMLTWDSTTLRIIVMVVVFVIGFIVFEYGKLGKRCRAIGSNEEASRQCGVNVDKVKMTGYLITGVMAGVLAFFTLIRTGTASTSTGNMFEMDCMIAILLGGMPITGGTSAKFRAVLLGSLTMTFLINGMQIVGIDTLIQQFVRGAIFLMTVALTFNRKTMAVIK